MLDFNDFEPHPRSIARHIFSYLTFLSKTGVPVAVRVRILQASWTEAKSPECWMPSAQLIFEVDTKVPKIRTTSQQHHLIWAEIKCYKFVQSQL